jgi:hypothetical protein
LSGALPFRRHAKGGQSSQRADGARKRFQFIAYQVAKGPEILGVRLNDDRLPLAASQDLPM